MTRQNLLRSSTILSPLLAVVGLSFSAVTILHAVIPYSTATVTRVENQVNYGQVSGGKSKTRPAVSDDVVKASDFLMSETESRAELKYEDGSIVRIGQNTIFSFDANTRTLKLDRGTFVFHIPKGMGGATIKTPSLTAAITGTIGKVSVNTIAIVEGEVTLVPSGKKVGQFQFARKNPDGSITIGYFDPSTAFDGKLMTFNGRIDGLPDKEFSFVPPPDDSISRATNQPGAVFHFNPSPVDRPPKTKVTPPPPPPKDTTKPPY